MFHCFPLLGADVGSRLHVSGTFRKAGPGKPITTPASVKSKTVFLISILLLSITPIPYRLATVTTEPKMSGLEKSLFQLKFTAKQLNRQAAKAGKEEQTEKNKVKKAMMAGTDDIARLYAQNAIRKGNERLNLLRLASRIDAVASRVQTAVTMRQVTGNMTNVIKGMDKALQTMNLEHISLVMEKFEQQFEDLDASTEYYEGATNNATALSTPQEEVDLLMSKVADEAGLEMKHNLPTQSAEQPVKAQNVEEKEDKLTQRLRALRG